MEVVVENGKATRSTIRVEIEEKVAQILDEHDDLTLMLLYQILHDGRNFRMENVSTRIEVHLKEQARIRNRAAP
jgi:hypothetical protein